MTTLDNVRAILAGTYGPAVRALVATEVALATYANQAAAAELAGYLDGLKLDVLDGRLDSIADDLVDLVTAVRVLDHEESPTERGRLRSAEHMLDGELGRLFYRHPDDATL